MYASFSLYLHPGWIPTDLQFQLDIDGSYRR